MLENFLTNAGTILTAALGLITVLWNFCKSPMGQALIAIWKNDGAHGARAFLENQALCIATKYKQMLVDGLREDMADGIITKEEMAARLQKIKEQALADFKASAVGGATLQALQIIGVQDTDRFLDQLLEGAVYKLKMMTPTPTSTKTTSASMLQPSGLVATVETTETKK